MSTSARALVFAFFALGLLRPVGVRAQINGIEAYADAIASAANPRWVGPRVPWPASPPRPDVALAVQSQARPIAVHSAARNVVRVELALATLEQFADFLAKNNWGRPAFDAMAGGSSDFNS